MDQYLHALINFKYFTNNSKIYNNFSKRQKYRNLFFYYFQFLFNNYKFSINDADSLAIHQYFATLYI